METTNNHPKNITPNDLQERVKRAVDNFMQGYGCCQSVVAAFADLYGLDDLMAKRIAAGFGGGVGRMRMMCGAVSGMVMLAGLDAGQTDGNDRKGKADCYAVVQRLVNEFKEENGSVICAELLGMSGCKVVRDSTVPDERNTEYYRVRPCSRKVENAARLFADYLEAKRQDAK